LLFFSLVDNGLMAAAVVYAFNFLVSVEITIFCSL
jgi:hypothetical protein